MAQVLKEDIKRRILLCAIEEFYSSDYISAKIRNIAKNAGVSLGLIYSYYKNKAALFEAVVSPVFNRISIATSKDKIRDDIDYDSFIKEEMEIILSLLRINRKELIILIDKSKGTKFENAKEDIIKMTQHHIEKQLKQKIKADNVAMDSTFYHILASNFMEGIFEVARHYKDDNWAKNIIDLLYLHHFYGISRF